jgi:hypothetical protein
VPCFLGCKYTFLLLGLRLTFFQVGLLHFVLSSMGITEISDEEIASLIGSDPGMAHAQRSGQDKLEAQQQINEENEGVVAEFRSLQVRCSCASCQAQYQLSFCYNSGQRLSWSCPISQPLRSKKNVLGNKPNTVLDA